MIVQLNDGSIVSVSAAVGQMMINDGRAQLYVPAVFEYETLAVGIDKEHNGIQDAWDAVADQPFEKEIRIQVDDGEYDIEGLVIDNHAQGHCLKIIGNLESPQQCKLRCGGGGVFFSNIRGVEFSGFLIEGNSAQTLQGVALDNQAQVYSAPQTLVISNCKAGLTVHGQSFYEAPQLTIIDCDNAVVCRESSTHVEQVVITGLDGSKETGLLAIDNGMINASQASLRQLRYAARAQSNGRIRCDGAIAEDAYVGFFAETGGGIDNNETGEAKRCQYGFVAQRHATLNAYKGKADQCRYGFAAYYGAHLYASESTAIDSERYGYTIYGGSVLEAWQSQNNASGNWRNYRLNSGYTGAANSILFYS